TAVVTDAAADGANSTTSTTAKTTTATKTSVLPANPTQATAWSCDSYSGKSTSTHINVNDSGSGQIIQYMQTDGDHCSEATVVGPAKFSADETRLAQLAPGGFARFREKTASSDRTLSAVPLGDGSLSYTATLDGHTVQFDAAM